MSSKKSLISIAVGSAFAATLGVAPIASAADNPFAAQSLDKGYMLADASKHEGKKVGEGKCGEGKCGEGKCGGAKASAAKEGAAAGKAESDKPKAENGKMKDGKCGSM